MTQQVAEGTTAPSGVPAIQNAYLIKGSNDFTGQHDCALVDTIIDHSYTFNCITFGYEILLRNRCNRSFGLEDIFLPGCLLLTYL